MEIDKEVENILQQYRDLDKQNQPQLQSHKTINSFITSLEEDCLFPSYPPLQFNQYHNYNYTTNYNQSNETKQQINDQINELYPPIEFTKMKFSARDVIMPKLYGQWKEVITYIENRQYNKLQTELEINDLRDGITNRWLGDELVNGYIRLLKTDKIGFIDSFFFTKLTKNWRLSGIQIDYENAKRWVRKIDVFSYDKILIPINIRNTHWILACINNTNDIIEVYDSLHEADREYGLRLQEFMRLHCEEKGVLKQYDIFCDPNCPHQRNGYDCGAFTCKCADCIRLDVDFEYSQNDMVEWRKLLVSQVVLNKLIVPN